MAIVLQCINCLVCTDVFDWHYVDVLLGRGPMWLYRNKHKQEKTTAMSECQYVSQSIISGQNKTDVYVGTVKQFHS